MTPTDWAQYGAIGLVLFSVIMGWLVPGPYYKEKQEENKQLRDALDEALKSLDSVEASMKHFATIVEKLPPFMVKILEDMKNIKDGGK